MCDVTEPSITRVSELLRGGSTRQEARREVARLRLLARGAYADTAGLSVEDLHILRARALVGRVGGVIASHVSAAAAWELPLQDSHLERVHLSPHSDRRGNPKAGPGYHLHTRGLAPTDVVVLNGLPVTSPLLTTLDCARWLQPDWGVVIADAALHRGLFDHDTFALAALGVRRLKGAERARALPALSSALAESPGESLLRLRLRRMGLKVTEQYSMPWVEGEPRVDFLVEGRLVVEFDGQGKYSLRGDPARAHWEEKLRHDRIVEAGNTMIHVVWADLWDEPALRRRVNRALTRARSTQI
jgi:very-short-patch-repair endonuclease